MKPVNLIQTFNLLKTRDSIKTNTFTHKTNQERPHVDNSTGRNMLTSAFVLKKKKININFNIHDIDFKWKL